MTETIRLIRATAETDQPQRKPAVASGVGWPAD